MEEEREIEQCLAAAAHAHQVPAALLYVILNVEAGRPGAVTRNANGSEDIGPMQVNDWWLPKLMIHWSTSREASFLALRDSICANFEAGAWILSQGFQETHDYWDAVARYHSPSGPEKQVYLGRILHAIDAMKRLRPPPYQKRED
ncbi:MAG: lytic transglycosylase domain-containing protein [Gluconacetobacter sp.]